MHLKRLTKPVKGIISVNEVKDHLCLTSNFTEQDKLIADYIEAVTDFVDGASGVLNRGLITQVWTMVQNDFSTVILIPLPPVISVDEIRYDDSAGVQQTLASSVYQTSYLGIDHRKAAVETQTGEVWPIVDDKLGTVEIDFTVGYGTQSTDLPGKVIQLVRFLVSSMFETRDITMAAAMKNPVYPMMVNNSKFWDAA